MSKISMNWYGVISRGDVREIKRIYSVLSFVKETYLKKNQRKYKSENNEVDAL